MKKKKKREGSTQKNNWRSWKQSGWLLSQVIWLGHKVTCAKLHTDIKELAGASFFCHSWCCLHALSMQTWYLVKWQLGRLQHSPWQIKSPRKKSRLRTMIILIWRWRGRMVLWCNLRLRGLGALGRPRGIWWRGRWEGGLGWGIHVNPWLIHVNVWQKPLQYCKVISLQLIKISGKKRKKNNIQNAYSNILKEFTLYPRLETLATLRDVERCAFKKKLNMCPVNEWNKNQQSKSTDDI